MKYTVHPAHSVPDWFDAAFKTAASTTIVKSAAASASAAIKAADAADADAVDTASADAAYGLWAIASHHKDFFHTAVMVAVAIAADVDAKAIMDAFKGIHIDLGDNA